MWKLFDDQQVRLLNRKEHRAPQLQGYLGEIESKMLDVLDAQGWGELFENSVIPPPQQKIKTLQHCLKN